LAQSFKAPLINALVAVPVIRERGTSGAESLHDHPILAALRRWRKVLEMQQQPQLERRV
jgi:hypothetical protein